MAKHQQGVTMPKRIQRKAEPYPTKPISPWCVRNQRAGQRLRGGFIRQFGVRWNCEDCGTEQWKAPNAKKCDICGGLLVRA